MRLLLALTAGWAFAAMALFAGPAQTASAHDYIISTTPGEGETATVQPDSISVTSSDKLIEVGAALQVSGPADAPLYYGDGCVSVDGPLASMPAQLGEAGTYTVQWRVTSSDGHPIDGSWQFEWAPDAEQQLAEGSAAAPVCGNAAAEPGSETAQAGTDAGTSAADTTGATGDSSGFAGEGTELAWIFGGLAVVVVGAVAAWMLVRRFSAGPPSE